MMKRRATMELKFEVVKNNNTSTSYHTNVVVGKTSIEHYASYLSGSYEDARWTQGQIVADMVRDLLRVPGMGDIFVHPYEVSVHLDSLRKPWVRWNGRIDEIVEETIKKLAKEQGVPNGKQVVVIYQGLAEFHTNFEVSSSVIEDFMRPLRESSKEYLNKVGVQGAILVAKLMNLPGITEVWIHPYEVSIKIGQVFNWTDRDNDGKTLEDKVKLAFEQSFGSNITFTTK